MKKNRVIIILNTVLLIVIDQICKYFIIMKKANLSEIINSNFLNFTYCENTGIAFGLGSNSIITCIIINIVILGILAKFLMNQSDGLENNNRIVLVLILAGGISNLMDRIFRGYVVDFIDINRMIKFPIFNLADIMICIGGIAFILITLKNLKTKNIGEGIKEINESNNCK